MLGFVLLLKMLTSMISIFFPLFGLVNTFKVAGHFNSRLFNPKIKHGAFQPQNCLPWFFQLGATDKNGHFKYILANPCHVTPFFFITHCYRIDVLWGQPIKLIQVVSTSEFHEYWWIDFIFLSPPLFAGPQK